MSMIVVTPADIAMDFRCKHSSSPLKADRHTLRCCIKSRGHMNTRRLSAVALACLALALCGQFAKAQTAPSASDGAVKIVVNANAVLVPVVVRDSQGRAVGDLKKEDFQIFDKNKPQAISGFSIQKRVEDGSHLTGAAPTPASAGTAQSIAPEPDHSTMMPDHFIVFLFDDFHLSAGDLAQIQKAATKMVAGSLADSDLAAVVSISGASSGLTRDRAKLQDAIMKLKVQSLLRPVRRMCPDIAYYEADRIQNKRDPMAVDMAVENTLVCCDCPRDVAKVLVDNAASESLQTGDRDVRVTLGAVSEIVRKMGAMPGQRTLILVAGLPDHDPGRLDHEIADSGSGGPVQCDDQRSGCARVVHYGARRQRSKQRLCYGELLRNIGTTPWCSMKT